MADTVGSLVDKISIVELKIYHMQEHFRAHPRTSAVDKIYALQGQRSVLAAELTELAQNPPQPFPQFKMYNDPQYRTK